MFSDLDDKILKESGVDFAFDALKNLINFAARYKNKGFSSEEEFRIYNYSRITSTNDIKKILYFENAEKTPVDIDYISSAKQIKKIMKIRLNLLNPKTTFNNTIDKIIIGPRSQQSISLLRDFIDHYGYKDLAKRIQDSICTLR